MHRTFPDNILFKSKAEPGMQKALYNVLLAYGHHNPTVGYCQVIKYCQGQELTLLLFKIMSVYLQIRTGYFLI